MTRQEGEGRRTYPFIYRVVYGIQIWIFGRNFFFDSSSGASNCYCEYSLPEEEVMKIPDPNGKRAWF
jgi:hypothetical protein